MFKKIIFLFLVLNINHQIISKANCPKCSTWYCRDCYSRGIPEGFCKYCKFSWEEEDPNWADRCSFCWHNRLNLTEEQKEYCRFKYPNCIKCFE